MRCCAATLTRHMTAYRSLHCHTPPSRYPQTTSPIAPYTIEQIDVSLCRFSQRAGAIPNPDNFAHYTLSNPTPRPTPRRESGVRGVGFY